MYACISVRMNVRTYVCSQVVEIPEGHQPFGRSVKESRWRDYLNRIIKWIEAADACAKAS